MIVNASWLDYDLLRIDVVDVTTGAVSSLAVRLSDFVTNADAQSSPYILIQALDMEGNLSGIVQISNPFYVPAPPTPAPPADSEAPDGSGDNGSEGDGRNQQGGLTPDGTGTVVDNVVTQNEIEFFTVYTEEGNVFFLVVDRLSSTDNVHLLNTVTEADLMALAEQSGTPIGGDGGISAVPTPPPLDPPADGQPPAFQPQPEPDPDAGDEPDPEAPPAGGGNRSWVFILIVVAAVGGAAYYFKIVKGRKNSAPDDDEHWNEGEDWTDDGDDADDYLGGEGAEEGGDEE
jgi:hypothetical protein